MENRQQELEKLNQVLIEQLLDDFEYHIAADALKDQILHMRRELKVLRDGAEPVGRGILDRYQRLAKPAEVASRCEPASGR